MKRFFLLFVATIPFTGCYSTKEDKNLSHLQDPEFIKSQPIPGALLEYPLYDRMHHFKVPGLSIAVVNESELVLAQGFGLGNIEDSLLVDHSTLFQAASVSKAIAALGILKLAESKSVDLDEDVNNYLKKIRIQENELTIKKKVTLRSILAHTSGLNVEGFEGYNQRTIIPTTLQVLNGKGNSEQVEVIAVPESEWHYSGGGYTVLQQIIEDVTDQPFEEFMRREVLEPLGMTKSTFEQPLPQKRHSNTSSAFDSSGRMFNGKWHNYPEKAAAGLWTTPTDLGKYIIAIQRIYSGKEVDGIISKAMVDDMFTDHYNAFNYLSNTSNIPGDYIKYWGMGLEVAVKDSILRFQHAGFNEGFKANFTAFANKGDAIIIMANGDNAFELMMEIEREISNYFNMGIWE